MIEVDKVLSPKEPVAVHKNILIVANVFTAVFMLMIVLPSFYQDVEDEENAKSMMTKFLFSTHRSFKMVHAKESESGVRIEICPNIRAENKFAFVTYISSASGVQKHLKWFVLSASKLAKSIRIWEMNADMVLLLAEDPYNKVSAFDVGLLEMSGWKICRVPFIASKISSNDNAKVFTKIYSWKLMEYERVALLDADLYAVGDPSTLFQVPDCAISVVASKDFGVPLYMDWGGSCSQSKSVFAKGLYLLKPSEIIFQNLNEGARLHQDETKLIQSVYGKTATEICTMPSEFNVDLAVKYCRRDVYEEENVIFAHFSKAKPWRMGDCEKWHIAEECRAWVDL